MKAPLPAYFAEFIDTHCLCPMHSSFGFIRICLGQITYQVSSNLVLIVPPSQDEPNSGGDMITSYEE